MDLMRGKAFRATGWAAVFVVLGGGVWAASTASGVEQRTQPSTSESRSVSSTEPTFTTEQALKALAIAVHEIDGRLGALERQITGDQFGSSDIEGRLAALERHIAGPFSVSGVGPSMQSEIDGLRSEVDCLTRNARFENPTFFC